MDISIAVAAWEDDNPDSCHKLRCFLTKHDLIKIFMNSEKTLCAISRIYSVQRIFYTITYQLCSQKESINKFTSHLLSNYFYITITNNRIENSEFFTHFPDTFFS